MPVKQIIDILLTPNLFRNIDFSRKGVYSLKFKVYIQNDKKQKIYAFPFLVDQQNISSDLFKTIVIQDTFQFKTKGFYINFNDQCIYFQTGCIFRLQLDKIKPEIIFIEMELLHIDIVHNDLENLSSLKHEDFKIKSTKIMKMNRLEANKQILFYGDIIIDTIDFFSVLQLGVQSRRLDYRFRINDWQLSSFSKMTQQQKQRCRKSKQILKIMNNKQIGKLLKEEFKDLDLQQYYQKLIYNQVNNYQTLRQKFRQITNLLGSLQSFDIQINLNLSKQNFPKSLSYLSQLIQGSQQQILQYLLDKYQVDDQQSLYQAIIIQSNQIARNIRYIWQKYSLVNIKTLRRRFFNLKANQEVQRNKQKKQRCVRSIQLDRNIEVQNFKIQQKNYTKSSFSTLGIKYPLIFASTIPQNHKKADGEVLNVFVHGFQGSQLDLQMMRNYIQIFHRETTNLLCHTLQNETQQNIQVLGNKFSNQVTRFIEKNSIQFKRINFIGYSLGGIIIRAGLKNLQKYKEKFNVLITLASPHLGISQMQNALVGVGIWYMIKFDKIKSMTQLNLKDPQNVMLQLSLEDSLKWLKKVIVVSSRQDGFVPNYSARIEVRDKGPQIRQIYTNIANRINQLIKIDVWFDSDSGAIDKILGRKSHIQFLQSEGFSEIFFSVFGALF